MEKPFLLLLVSFLGSCGTMFYILFRNRNDRKSSVSLHAALDDHSHFAFAMGHFIGGLAFLYFVYKYFYVDRGSLLLLVLAFFGVLFEQIQAFLPDKKSLSKIHTIAAGSMAVFISLMIFAGPIIFQLSTNWLIAYVSLIFLLCASGVYAVLN